MRACPNLFDLIYQHAAFPLTWEPTAVTPLADRHLSLSLSVSLSLSHSLSATSDHRINPDPLSSMTSKEVPGLSDKATFIWRDRQGVRHSLTINLLLSLTHPIISLFFYLSVSSHCIDVWIYIHTHTHAYLDMCVDVYTHTYTHCI